MQPFHITPPLPNTAVHALRFALTGKPLPLVAETVRIGELARQAVMSCLGGTAKSLVPTVISGHDGDHPTQGQHRHGLFLPGDEDCDGYLDHLTIYAAAGLDEALIRPLLTDLRRLYSKGPQEWGLLPLGCWDVGALRATDGPWRPAATWESVTPLILTRYPKQYRDGRPKLNHYGEQKDGPEDQVRREWELRRSVEPALPELVTVGRLDCHRLVDGRQLGWLQFDRSRSEGSGASAGFAYGLRLRFAEPVPGPMALGYGCHFGLGQFRCVE